MSNNGKTKGIEQELEETKQLLLETQQELVMSEMHNTTLRKAIAGHDLGTLDECASFFRAMLPYGQFLVIVRMDLPEDCHTRDKRMAMFGRMPPDEGLDSFLAQALMKVTTANKAMEGLNLDN